MVKILLTSVSKENLLLSVMLHEMLNVASSQPKRVTGWEYVLNRYSWKIEGVLR